MTALIEHKLCLSVEAVALSPCAD